MAAKFDELDDAGKLAEVKKRLANVSYGYDVSDLNQSYVKHVGWLVGRCEDLKKLADIGDSLRTRAEDRADRLEKFKQWVHSYLDARGVPAHPDGPHSKEGCRIGDRMDLVFAELQRLKGEQEVPL